MITMITGSVLILLAVVSPLLNPFFRFKKTTHHSKSDAEQALETSNLPPLSLVLTPYDDNFKLAECLPYYLRQDYPAGCQVIVVMEQGDTDTESLVSQIYHQHRQEHPDTCITLYITAMPQTSRYISKKKLAITLGIKAAQTELVMLAETDSYPPSQQWLSTMASYIDDTHNLVIGFSKYEEDTAGYKRFEALHTQYYLMREAAYHTTYRNLNGNMLIRKQDFLERQGFLGNLHLVRGEYDFLANCLAHPKQTKLVTTNEGWLIDSKPTPKQWKNRHDFYLETRKYLKRSLPHRALYNIDQSLMHLTYILIGASILFSALTARWLLLAVAGLACCTTLVLRMVIGRRAYRNFEVALSPVSLVFFEITMIWHRLGYWISHRLRDKRDFTTHKL